VFFARPFSLSLCRVIFDGFPVLTWTCLHQCGHSFSFSLFSVCTTQRLSFSPGRLCPSPSDDTNDFLGIPHLTQGRNTTFPPTVALRDADIFFFLSLGNLYSQLGDPPPPPLEDRCLSPVLLDKKLPDTGGGTLIFVLSPQGTRACRSFLSSTRVDKTTLSPLRVVTASIFKRFPFPLPFFFRQRKSRFVFFLFCLSHLHE